MAKLGMTHIVVSVPRLVTAAVFVGVLIGGTQMLPQPSQTHSLQPQPTAVKETTPYTAAPQTIGQPAPAPTPQATSVVPKLIPKVHITQAAAPAPVVNPSPSASVSSLKPVDPTTTPTTTGGSSGSSSASSPAVPLTTTAYTSSNWSGYFAATDNYTGVSGSWTVPTATNTTRRSASDAAWIGIGGVTNGDLLQVGTEDYVSRSGTQTSSAFYELLPAASVTIPSLHVSAGDSMTASLTEVSSGKWTISIADTTTGSSYTNIVPYVSTHSSAEWIEEDPSYESSTLVPLDNFGTITFSGATATTSSGPLTLTSSNAQPITMLAGSGAIASPSAIGSDGKTFTVTHM